MWMAAILGSIAVGVRKLLPLLLYLVSVDGILSRMWMWMLAIPDGITVKVRTLLLLLCLVRC
jgi:hypothetical protein